MAVTVNQTWEGYELAQTQDDGTIRSEYVVAGTSDEVEAHDELNTATSLLLAGLIKKAVRITERLAQEAWKGEVEWGRLEPKETGDSSYQFNTGGGTTHIQNSLATVNSYAAPGKTAPDFKTAIGVGDSSVDGVDVTTPQYTFSETHYLDVATVSAAYKNTLFTLTGTVNSLAFKGFSAGEVLFLGCTGSLRAHDQWEITYNFSASPNATGLAVGDITGITKAGWDYLWVRFRDEEDATAKQLVRRPIAAYVERVYTLADLNLLGI